MASSRNGQQSPANDETELRYLIERLLARTSLASEGQGKGLDVVLGELRQYLRGHERAPARLREFQERLDHELDRLDDQSLVDDREAGRILGALLSAAENAEPFSERANDLKRLRRELGPQGLPRQQWLPWLEDFSKLAEQAMAGPERVAPEKGFFDRLFRRRDEAPGHDTQSVDHQLSDQPTGLDLSARPFEGGAPGAGDSDQRLRIARRVSELMDRVVQQVDLPPDTHKRAILLKSRLSDQQDWDLLRQSLDETADLVIAVVTHSQREFEHFLQRLDERLSSLHGHFSDHANVVSDRRSSAAALEQSVQAQLSELGGSLHTSSDLSELRASVTHHIDGIARTVEAYREQEDQREQRVHEQMDAMKEKLVAMEAHAEQIRTQLEQERARALTDLLTQLPNREAWQERLRFEYQRWQRYGHPVALTVIDIDHFKRVNDSFGHKAGDRVIQLVAKALEDRLRSTDFVARYGGEEFVALLPETDLEQAMQVVEDLRQHVAGMPFHFQGQPVRVTVSAGLSGFREDAEPEVVFEEADKALYNAKRNGRDRVETAMEFKRQ